MQADLLQAGCPASTRLTAWAPQAGRKTVGEMQGSILFAGKKAKPAFLKRYTGYTEQFDTLIAGALSWLSALTARQQEQQLRLVPPQS